MDKEQIMDIFIASKESNGGFAHKVGVSTKTLYNWLYGVTKPQGLGLEKLKKLNKRYFPESEKQKR